LWIKGINGETRARQRRSASTATASLKLLSGRAVANGCCGNAGSGRADCIRSSRVEFLASTSSARRILFPSAHAINSRLTFSGIG